MNTTTITEKSLYDDYKNHLLNGDNRARHNIIQQLIESDTSI